MLRALMFVISAKSESKHSIYLVEAVVIVTFHTLE